MSKKISQCCIVALAVCVQFIVDRLVIADPKRYVEFLVKAAPDTLQRFSFTFFFLMGEEALIALSNELDVAGDGITPATDSEEVLRIALDYFLELRRAQ
jgi:hypothetical protein